MMKITPTNTPPWQDPVQWSKVEHEVRAEEDMLMAKYEALKPTDPGHAQTYADEANVLGTAEEEMFNCDGFPIQNDPDDRKAAYEGALTLYQRAVKRFGPPKQYI